MITTIVIWGMVAFTLIGLLAAKEYAVYTMRDVRPLHLLLSPIIGVGTGVGILCILISAFVGLIVIILTLLWEEIKNFPRLTKSIFVEWVLMGDNSAYTILRHSDLHDSLLAAHDLLIRHDDGYGSIANSGFGIYIRRFDKVPLITRYKFSNKHPFMVRR